MKNEQIEDAVIIGDTARVETTVKNEISKFNLADAGIEALKKKYKGLKVKSQDDEKGIAAVKDAVKVVSKVRIDLEKKRKEIKQPFLEIGKDIDAEAKRLTALILEVENPLQAEAEKVKKWETEAAEKAEAERQEKIKNRVSELSAAGLVFNGELYAINDISMDIVSIEKMSEADFAFLVAKVKQEKAKNDAAEAERLEAERLEKERQQKLVEDAEKQRLENRAEKLEMRTEKLEALGFTANDEIEIYEFVNYKEFIRISYDDAAEMSKADFDNFIQQHKNFLSEIEEKKRKQEAIDRANLRLAKISALGVIFDGGHYLYKENQIDVFTDSDIDSASDDEWSEILNAVREKISGIEAEIALEQKRQDDEKAAKEKADLESRLPDLDKISLYADELLKIPVPQLKHEKAQELLAKFKNDLKLATDNVKDEIKKLSK